MQLLRTQKSFANTARNSQRARFLQTSRSSAAHPQDFRPVSRCDPLAIHHLLNAAVRVWNRQAGPAGRLGANNPIPPKICVHVFAAFTAASGAGRFAFAVISGPMGFTNASLALRYENLEVLESVCELLI